MAAESAWELIVGCMLYYTTNFHSFPYNEEYI